MIICNHCKLPTVPKKIIETVDRERDVSYVSDCCEAGLVKEDGTIPTLVEITAMQ